MELLREGWLAIRARLAVNLTAVHGIFTDYSRIGFTLGLLNQASAPSSRMPEHTNVLLCAADFVRQDEHGPESTPQSGRDLR